MAKALGGDAPEMYQRKGSSNLLTSLCQMNAWLNAGRERLPR